MNLLNNEQVAFYKAFGFVVLPKLVLDDIEWITSEFEAVFTDKGVKHDDTKRSCIVPFIDQREKFSTLLDHPNIAGLAASLIGEDFNYLGGDGNYYTGDTNWHSDGFHRVGDYLKIALYLDPVTRDTGALRVIPGSHTIESKPHWEKYAPGNAQGVWSIPGSAVPSVALESNPGDVVAFNHNLYHAAYGGSSRRRMFTLNLCRHAETPAEIQELVWFNEGASRFWIDRTYTDIMVQTASAERMRHLEQTMANQGQLAELAAKSRREQTEAARG